MSDFEAFQKAYDRREHPDFYDPPKRKNICYEEENPYPPMRGFFQEREDLLAKFLEEKFSLPSPDTDEDWERQTLENHQRLLEGKEENDYTDFRRTNNTESNLWLQKFSRQRGYGHF